MRAIGYFRCGENLGPSGALGRAFHEYCDRNLHQAFKVFEDAEEGAEGEYPGYQGMLSFMRESGSRFLTVVPDARHLGADLEAVARAMVELEGIGAKVVCAEEDLPDPLQNALHNLGVKGVSKTRSHRIKESMQARALNGQSLGRPPYGYRNGPDGLLEVVPGEAPVVELIYRLYTGEGIGLRMIAQRLNERGILTRRGGRWNIVTIRDILRNPVYIGTYTRFGLRVPKTHEPIVTGQTFREVQDKMRRRRPVGRVVNKEPFLLSRLATCGYCGDKMMGVTRRQGWRLKNGRRSSGVYRYYQCQSRNNQSVCRYHTWRASLLEGSVMGQLKQVLKTNGAAAPPSSGEAWVRNAEHSFLRAMKRAAKGQMSVRMLGAYLDELDQARSRAKAAEQPHSVEATLAEWDSLDVSERRNFLAAHVARIVVKDDAVEVTV